MWNLKNKTSQYKKKKIKKQTHRYRKLVVTMKVREDGRGKTGAGIKRYKLLCIK